MKKINFLIIAVAAFSLTLSSCKEDKLDLFQGEDNIIFAMSVYREPGDTASYKFNYNGELYSQVPTLLRTAMDSLYKSYAFLDPAKRTTNIFIPISVVGTVSDVDRKVACQLYKLDDDGKHSGEVYGTQHGEFRIIDAFVPAGKEIGGIIVEVDRDIIPQRITVGIGVELLPNENFNTNCKTVAYSKTKTDKLVSTLNFRVYASDGMGEPPLWYVAKNNFGKWSVRKYYVLTQDCMVPHEYAYPESFASINTALYSSYAHIFKRYLQDQKDAGTPVLEDDNTEMTAIP